MCRHKKCEFPVPPIWGELKKYNCGWWQKTIFSGAPRAVNTVTKIARPLHIKKGLGEPCISVDLVMPNKNSLIINDSNLVALFNQQPG